MTEATVHTLKKQGVGYDPLTQVIRDGAQRLLAQAIEAEVDSFIEYYKEERNERGSGVQTIRRLVTA